jgi:hypothetical protein
VLRTLGDEEKAQFWQVVSEALENASADAEFRSAIQIAEKDWKRVSEIARIRAEHRLIESINEGEYDPARKICPRGALGTWAKDLGAEFVLQDDLVTAIVGRCCSKSLEGRLYGFQYFFQLLQQLRPTPPRGLVWSLKKRLKEEQEQIVFDALNWVTYEAFADENDEWVKAFKEAVEAFKPAEPAEISDDDIPF